MDDWVAFAVGPLIGALIASVGYLAKLGLDHRAENRKVSAQRTASLAELHSILTASRAAFISQVELRRRLIDLLKVSHPHITEVSRSDDWKFRQCYPSMSEEERSLHVIIRGYTEHAIFPMNRDTLNWLAKDTYFRTGQISSVEAQELARMLSTLNAHLMLWVAKYQVWIPEKPENALVLLLDEERHGVGFPRGIEAVISSVLYSSSGLRVEMV